MLKKLYAKGATFAEKTIPALIRKIAPEAGDKDTTVGYVAVALGGAAVVTGVVGTVVAVATVGGAALGVAVVSGKAIAISAGLAPVLAAKTAIGAGVVAGGEKNCGIFKRAGVLIGELRGRIADDQKNLEQGWDIGYETPFIDKNHEFTKDRDTSVDFRHAADFEKMVDASRGIVPASKQQKPKR